MLIGRGKFQRLLFLFWLVADLLGLKALSSFVYAASEDSSLQSFEVGRGEPEAESEFPRKFGLGLTLGTLDGISGFYRLSPTKFVQGLFGIGGKGNFYGSGDFCITLRSLSPQVPHFIPFYGIGFILASYHNGWDRLIPERYVDRKDKVFAGLRLPLGVQFYIPDTPLQVGAELGPAILFAGDTYVYLQSAVNLRFAF